VDQCIRKLSTAISKPLGLSSPNEILSGRDSCMSCSMHRIRSCAHSLRRDQESGMQAGVEIGMWKKLPLVSWGWRWDEGEEEERIRTEK
jgi:hypothetical protein